MAGPISSYRNIEQCLAALEQEVEPVERKVPAEAIASAIREPLNDGVSIADFALGDLTSSSVKAFATGKPIFAISYELSFALQSKRESDVDRVDALVTAGDRHGFFVRFDVARQRLAWCMLKLLCMGLIL